MSGRRSFRCYQPREWERVELPAEKVAAGMEVVRRRVRTLPHDSGSTDVIDWLVAAYTQGLLDGAQIADRLNDREPPVPDERMGL